MEGILSQPPKLPFIDIFRQSQPDYDMLVTIVAELAKVYRSIINTLIVGNPIAPNDAQATLTILSHTGKTWSWGTVDVPLVAASTETETQYISTHKPVFNMQEAQ